MCLRCSVGGHVLKGVRESARGRGREERAVIEERERGEMMEILPGSECVN